MSAIKILSETRDTVTLRRADLSELLAAVEDAEDRAAVRAHRAEEAVMGKEAARRNYLTGDEARRLLDGENPVRLWREKRGLTQRALAARAGMAASYLADIESGRKPGSADALSRLAGALGVSIEDLLDEQPRKRQPEYGPVYLRLAPPSIGVAPAQRGAVPEERRFDSIRAAWNALHDEWPSLKNRLMDVADQQRLPIFSLEDIWRDMEPELFGPRSDGPVIRFEEDVRWSSKLACCVMWADVDGQPIRCRLTEQALRECFDDPHVTRKELVRLFQRHRAVIERAFHRTIRAGRLADFDDGGTLRKEAVLTDRDFLLFAD